MKDITHHQKRCAEIMGWNPENKFLPFYKSDWREQIPVWQKIWKLLDALCETTDPSKGIADKDFEIMNFDVHYSEQIRQGTPETAFTILCQAIDFIDTNGKEKEK